MSGNDPLRTFAHCTLIELTGLVVFQNLSRKFNAALGVEPQGLCAVAPQYRESEVTADHRQPLEL
jgi:hypothetical protein